MTLETKQNEIDRLRELTNPVYSTAKATLQGLANCGDQDALLLMEKLGSPFDPRIQSLPEAIVYSSALIENRYRTINQLLKENDRNTIIDIPCGYTPRAIDPLFKEQSYIGLDLPAVIEEVSSIHEQILKERDLGQREFHGIDATNYASFRSALDQVQGEVVITSEGLMMYFSELELKAFISNMARILHEFGGEWISFDMETNRLTSTVIRTIMSPKMKEAMLALKGDYVENQNIWRFENSITVDDSGSRQSIEKVKDYLKGFGLKAKRVSVSEHMPELEGLKRLDPKMQNTLKENLKPVCLWIMTPDQQDYTSLQKDSEHVKFQIEMAGEQMQIKLDGRIDSLSAPDFLALYQKVLEKEKPGKIFIDAAKLEYISSAGLRVLLIMLKQVGQKNLVVENCREEVRSIFEQTGFDNLLLRSPHE